MRAKGYEVYIRQAEPSQYLSVLEDFKMKEIFNIIIDIQPEKMVNLLNVVSCLYFTLFPLASTIITINAMHVHQSIKSNTNKN